MSRAEKLDYRMVEWWNAEGTSYSLVQVVSRVDAIATEQKVCDDIRAAFVKIVNGNPVFVRMLDRALAAMTAQET